MDRDTAPDIEDVPELLEVDDSGTGSEVEVEGQAGPSRVLERPKIPITLLTGYLGAGKSTLLEYVLTAEHGYKIAVCMNDFGDTTDIEAKSLTLSDPDTNSQTTSFLSLPNGCLCCSFKDMGIAAIEEMVASQKGVDWVMVELTGVADPGPIARSFWANEEMGDLILDGVVCVVDCRNVIKQLGESKPDSKEANDCQKQVACADVILLNKTDLVSPEHLKEVERRIRQINPTLRVHHTVQSRIPLESLFNIRAFSSDSTSLPLLTSIPRDTDPDHQHGGEDHADHDHAHAHEHEQQKNPHYNDITTIMIPLPTLSSQQHDQVEKFLQSLLWDQRLPIPSGGTTERSQASEGSEGKEDKELEILRTKGYLKVEDGREYVVQGVTDIFEMKPVPSSSDRKSGGSGGEGEGEMGGKLVFIGRGLGPELQDAFNSFVGI